MTLAAMFAAVAISFSACTPEDNPGTEDDKNGQENVTPDDKPNEENNSGNNGNTGTTTPTDDLAPEIKSGDCVLAPNSNVEKFVSEVTYPDHNYSTSVVTDYHGGYNGNLAEGEAVTSDQPSEYTIRWTADVSAGKLMFELCEIETGWKMEKEITEGSDNVAITNLTPDVHYTYKVASVENGTIMTEGEFSTYGSIRQVFFKTKVRNGRDLGGWKTYDYCR